MLVALGRDRNTDKRIFNVGCSASANFSAVPNLLICLRNWEVLLQASSPTFSELV